jgi:hypothetical protein
MRVVRLIKDWDRPEVTLQTPGARGVWEDVQFTAEPVEQCDYVVVLNRVPQETVVRCPPEHIWAFMQEPPVPEFRWLRKGFDQYARIYTPDVSLRESRVIHSHGVMFWHVNRDYDFIRQCPPPEKPKTLSWITSSASRFRGHKRRLAFLRRLQAQVDFDLWGRGFRPIDDKWDGLAPYRYSMAVENYRGPNYWSEKLADCYLGWVMPIYCGCTNITDYFPKESFVSIDIEDRDAVKIVQETIKSDLWLRRRDAIAYARELVLQRYQFFPFVTEQIRTFEQTSPSHPTPQSIILRQLPWSMPEPFKKRLWWRAMLAQRAARDRVRGSLAR